MAAEIRIDRIRCDGHGWYPLLAPGPVPEPLREHATQAVAACPVMALRLERVAAALQSSRRT